MQAFQIWRVQGLSDSGKALALAVLGLISALAMAALIVSPLVGSHQASVPAPRPSVAVAGTDAGASQFIGQAERLDMAAPAASSTDDTTGSTVSASVTHGLLPTDGSVDSPTDGGAADAGSPDATTIHELLP